MPTFDRGVRGKPLGLRPGCPEPRLYDVCVRIFRMKHYSPRTEKSYLAWIRRYIAFHGGRHPAELGVEHVNAFLSDLATTRKVSRSTQNVALSAILFLYDKVLDIELPDVEDIVRTKKPKNLPTVVTPEEFALLLSHMEGTPKLVAMIQYGSGLRLNEALSLRVKDLDFGRGEVSVRRGKGGKDRITMLPRRLNGPLTAHLEIVEAQHLEDLSRGLGRVPLPDALRVKFPHAELEWTWQWLFPARSYYVDRVTRVRYKFHVHDTVVQKAVRSAALALGFGRRVTTHTFRHTFATELLRSGYDIRTVQELMGHESVTTTQIYTHVLNRGGFGVNSPLDAIDLPDNHLSYPAREAFLKDRSPEADQQKRGPSMPPPPDYPDRDNPP